MPACADVQKHLRATYLRVHISAAYASGYVSLLLLPVLTCACVAMSRNACRCYANMHERIQTYLHTGICKPTHIRSRSHVTARNWPFSSSQFQKVCSRGSPFPLYFRLYTRIGGCFADIHTYRHSRKNRCCFVNRAEGPRLQSRTSKFLSRTRSAD